MQIIYGLPDSGKSKYCLDMAEQIWKGKNDTKVFFIVPEQYSYETEKTLVEKLGIISPKTVEVLSFKRLFFYVCNNIGGSLLPRLTDTSKHILLSRIASKYAKELKTLGKTAKYSGFSDVLITLFSEFKRYNISAYDLKNVSDNLADTDFLKLKLQDIILLYESYETALEGKFSDPDSELTLLCNILQNNEGYFSDSVFFIDQFDGFTPQETLVIGELAKQSQETYITLCTDNLYKTSGLFSMQAKTFSRLTELAKRYGFTNKEPIFLNKFCSFSGKPSFVHLENALRNESYKIFNEATQDIHMLSALNLNKEVAQVAQIICELVKNEGYRYRDFTVVTANLESYRELILWIFSKYDIPLYLSEKTPLSQEIPCYAILCVINIIIKKWDYESVFAYLKTGFSGLTDYETDFLENYIIKTGIRSSSWTNGKKWKYKPKGFSDIDLEKIEEIREKFVTPVLLLQEKIKDAKNVRDYIRILVEYMQNQDFFGKILKIRDMYRGLNADLSAKYDLIYKGIISAFEDIDRAVPIDDEISLDEFYSMLSTAFECNKLGVIPTSVDSVTVTDTERCRSAKCKVMFVIGVNEGFFPQVFESEGIIKDNERNKLENMGLALAPDTVSRMLDEDFIVYSTLLTPSDRLYISYPLSNIKGESLSPSSLIRKLLYIFPQISQRDNIISDTPLNEVISKEVALDMLAEAKGELRDGKKYNNIYNDLEKWFKNRPEYKYKIKMVNNGFNYKNNVADLSKDLIDKVYGDEFYTSVSRLESYKKCPFMYYAKYMLGANPREDTQLKSVDTGTIMHSIVEKVSLLVKEKYDSWHKVPDNWIEENVKIISDKAIEEFISQLDFVEPRQMFTILRLKDTVVKSVTVMTSHLKNSEFIPMGYEISFDEGEKYGCINLDVMGKKVKLRGKVDRSDMYVDKSGRKFIRIIDYKSGKRDFDIRDFFYGLNIQLAVYLDSMTQAENAIGAGILYFRLFDPIVNTDRDLTEDEMKNLEVKNYKTTGLVLGDGEIIKKMDSRALEGDGYLPVAFKADGGFTATSKVATYNEFNAINIFLRDKLEEMAKDLIKGKTDISPIITKRTDPCLYCDYKQMCQYDFSCGNRHNRLEDISKEDAWAEIRKKGK
ncbi:MAG: PD-(D/E)XK nuclease family protein [Clostridia bacterium]|nr:PD-(D/E)XK nuclease family protein [Clostridia bacterium]